MYGSSPESCNFPVFSKYLVRSVKFYKTLQQNNGALFNVELLFCIEIDGSKMINMRQEIAAKGSWNS